MKIGIFPDAAVVSGIEKTTCSKVHLRSTPSLPTIGISGSPSSLLRGKQYYTKCIANYQNNFITGVNKKRKLKLKSYVPFD